MQRTCEVFRVAGAGKPESKATAPGYRGVPVPMIVMTEDRGIVMSMAAPENTARLWARCHSLNTAHHYRVQRKHRSTNPREVIAVYKDGQNVL